MQREGWRVGGEICGDREESTPLEHTPKCKAWSGWSTNLFGWNQCVWLLAVTRKKGPVGGSHP
ncbi:hypothetical protein KDAU_74700 [Dictyobacter aurantiacus]|uniref:Uncharacterized protein n=1 Tax=Dictyobacter aurantiacus TaxID=1936993 RepID=A0A401ZLX0_9CHLR|nr:hypothetical protein KDAU_00010 [Dictyobacter aurantiacus]GCE07775.1 hypothetical protein KDAU_51040 [Dictyobacter aurantiacus]GCE07776.1 hypothetical protein KDAU_51050 [Dictyobacter aurantiacus]GCE10141.1 hypothetical protein KDAU_74700 [Dictyobacter aurantiacus]